MAQRTIPRPATFDSVVNPWSAPELYSATPIGAQPGMMQPPAMPPALAGAPRRVPTTVEPMQGLGPMGTPQAAAAPAMPMPQGQPGGGGFMSNLKGGVNDFLGSDASLAMAAGLLGGGSTMEAVGRGFAGAAQARGPERERQQEQAQANKTVEYFEKMGRQDLAEMARLGYGKEAFSSLTNKGSEYGLTPIPIRRNDGTFGWAVVGKDGSTKELSADQAELLSPFDRRFEERAGQEAGKSRGEAIASYESMSAKMPGLEQVVNSLDKLAETATYTLAGQIRDQIRLETGQEPTQAAIDRATYVAMVNNQILPLLRDTFGAQFTEREGVALRETLGDPNLQPEAKKAVLKAFIEQKRRDVEAVARQAGIDPPVPGALDPAIEDLVRTYGG